MKICPKCGNQIEDSAQFCNNCGFSFQQQNNAQQPNGAPDPMNYQTQAVADPFDHTQEFAPEDVHDNKLFALLCYLSGVIGIIIALLVKKGNNSPYLAFHIKQTLKLYISEILVGLITVVLCWTCIVPVAGAVCLIILLIVDIICFVNTCQNKSVEPYIVRGFGFLK